MKAQASRRVQPYRGHIEAIEVDDGFDRDPRRWLEQQAVDRGYRYLLAHADDGVIWGVLEDGSLQTSDQADAALSPSLRGMTLRECRLFGREAGELLVWRSAATGGWHARHVADEPSDDAPRALDETYVLWGDGRERERPSQDERFTILAEGAQGLRHAVPLQLEESRFVGSGSNGERVHPVLLDVRHYLEEQGGETGQLFIRFSRLMDLRVEGDRGEEDR